MLSCLPVHPTRRAWPAWVGAACVAAVLLAMLPAQAQTPSGYGAVTAQTRDVASRYFAAYVDRRWDDLAPLLAASARFQDPTAALVFGGVAHSGKPAMLKLFREGYAAITEMHFKPMRQFAAGAHAVFEGDLDWTLRLQDGRLVHSVTPLVTQLRVVDGQVVEHVDLVDYQPFLDAMAQRAPRAGG